MCTQACKASQVAENSGGAAGGVFVMLDTCGSNLGGAGVEVWKVGHRAR